MQIKVTKSHKITFQVQYFLAEEGGMDNEAFGEPVESIEKAIALLELAKANDKINPWIITAEVVTAVSGEPVKS